MSKHYGSCHCGAVKFTIDANITELTTCDCSLCMKKNALMTKVHESGFELLSQWNEVSEYNWNTKVARHYFCKTCGIYTFHKKRSQPDHYGINVNCLDEFDASKVETRKTQGLSMSVVASQARDVWQGPRKD